MSFGYIPGHSRARNVVKAVVGVTNLIKRIQGPSIIEALQLRPNTTCLDIGCGQGYLTYEIAKRSPAVGIDPRVAAPVKRMRIPSEMKVGLDWLVPDAVLAIPLVASIRGGLSTALIVAASLAPLALFVAVWRSSSGPMPLIALLAVVSNGVWFLVLAPLDAFVYATVFHSAQYLAIAIIFHVREQTSRAGNRRGALYHGIWFYGMSLLLGYGVVSCLPLAYVYAGFGRVEAVMLVIAALNLHHFIVDAYVWRLGRSDGNRRIVDSGAVVGALSPDPT